MARLPSIADLGLGAGPQPAGAVIGYKGGEENPNAIPAALAEAGAELSQAGSTQYNLYRGEQAKLALEYKQEQARANAARAEDAFNQFRQKTLDLSAGKDGFQSLQGGQVASNPNLLNDYSKRAQDAARLIGDGLDNATQRQMFKQRADLGLYQFQHDLLNHITSERKVYDKEIYKGTLEVETNLATAHYQDPVAVATSVERIRAATNAMADSQGLPQEGPGSEARTAALTENVGKVHQSVIGQAIADNNYKYAKDWFQRYGDSMEPGVQAQTRRLLLDGDQKEAFNGFAQRFNEVRRDMKGLRQLDQDVATDKNMDETRRTALQGRIEGAVNALENKARMDQERAERHVMAQITQFNTDTLMGYPHSAASMAPLINASRGTTLEPMVRQMVALTNETERFQRMPPPQQEAYVNRLESSARADPTKFDVNMVNRFKAIQQAQKEAVREDPVGFVVRQGFVDQAAPAAQPIDFSKPDAPEFATSLQARFALARQVGERYQTQVKPLQPAEAGLLANATRGMQPEAKRDYFSRLAKAAGADTAGYRAMMQQISPDDMVTAAGGIAAMRGVKNADGQFVADDIFRGQSYLHPPNDKDGKPGKATAVMPHGPDEAQMHQIFDGTTGSAFEGKPEARAIFMETARALYASKTVKKGDFSGNLDSQAWRASINDALGAEPLNWNGKTVIPPANMKAGDFKDQLRLRYDDMQNRGALPQGVSSRTLWNLPLENRGDGRYIVRSGDAALAGADGRPIVLDFNQPFVPAPSTVVAGDVQQWQAATGGKLKPGQTQADAVSAWKQGAGDLQRLPNPSQAEMGRWDKRADGSQKGLGFFGLVARPNGGGDYSSELSVGVNIDGKEVEIPSMVPGLTRAEIKHLVGGGEPTRAIVDKAVEHARKRMKAGKSVWAAEGEQGALP